MDSARTIERSNRGGNLTSAAPTSRKLVISGNIVIGFVALFLFVDGFMKAMTFESSVNGTLDFGYPERLVIWIGITLLVCTILYAIPRTAFLGAILLTGYLGGATASQVRLEDMNFLFAVAFGVLVWVGLYLRDGRLRALVSQMGVDQS